MRQQIHTGEVIACPAQSVVEEICVCQPGWGHRSFVSPAPSGDHPAESLAQRFHETYERLAPQFGYETRKESAKPWAEVPENNKRLMIAVCQELLTNPTPQLKTS